MILPLGKRTLIKLPPVEDTTEAGIILTKVSREQFRGRGEVVATNSDVVKVGDTVLYCQYGPVEVSLDKVDYAIAEDIHLVAIITK